MKANRRNNNNDNIKLDTILLPRVLELGADIMDLHRIQDCGIDRYDGISFTLIPDHNVDGGSIYLKIAVNNKFLCSMTTVFTKFTAATATFTATTAMKATFLLIVTFQNYGKELIDKEKLTLLILLQDWCTS